MTVVGLKAPALTARKSGFMGSRVAALPSIKVARSGPIAARANLEYPQNWLPKSGTVLVAGFLGWTFPSSIPVSALGDQSLFSKFTGEIGEHLALFPQGPPLDDQFWLYMITWHVGLFTVLLLGQIGVQGRKQGYWG